VPDLGALFAHEFLQENPLRRIAARGLHASIDTLRDRYMAEIYRRVTVNLSHLAATALLQAVERGEREVEVPALILQIYLALKRLQPQQHIHLHRSLINPGVYRLLLDGQSRDLQEFLASGVRAKLLELHGEQLRCLDKLEADHAFDAVRLENPIEVCANEVAPLPELAAALREALIEQRAHDARAMAMHAFDDARRLLAWDRQLFQGEKHREINAQETATADPAPFLLLPTHPRRLGVLLVHGFLASPGETRPFGEALARAGYPVMGVRLRGHGTSPWDLRERAWRNWFESLQQGYQILAPFCTQICIVGFSTGGALTLISAAQAPTALAGIVAIAPPFRFRNHNMRYVPLVHGANQLVEWVSNHEGVLPFRPTTTEHPDINYRHMPIRGLYELTRMVATVRKTLPDVRCPTLVIQGTEDPVVEPAGAEEVIAKLGSRDKRLAWVPSQRHGILYEAIGDTQRLVFEFLARLEGAAQGQQDAPLPGPATASEVR
jgi:esterase/lipase